MHLGRDLGAGRYLELDRHAVDGVALSIGQMFIIETMTAI